MPSGADLWNICQALHNEVQSLVGTAHASQDKDLLPHEPLLLAQLVGSFQPVALACDQEAHEPARIVLGVQLHLRQRLLYPLPGPKAASSAIHFLARCFRSQTATKGPARQFGAQEKMQKIPDACRSQHMPALIAA